MDIDKFIFETTMNIENEYRTKNKVIEKKPFHKEKIRSDGGILLRIVQSANSYWDVILAPDEKIKENKDK